MANSQLIYNFRLGSSGPENMLVCSDGVITEVGQGSAEYLFKKDHFGQKIDLSGHWLMPGFVDNHCHILATGIDLLRPSLRDCNLKTDVLILIHELSRIGEGWIVATGYDQNKWGGEHISLSELDAICDHRPILLRHSNHHAGIANSLALQAANVRADELDIEGGRYGRNADGKLNGSLFELAFNRVNDSIPSLSVSEAASAITAAGKLLQLKGISVATDMGSAGLDYESVLAAYRLSESQGNSVKMRLYLPWSKVFGPKALSKEVLEDYSDLILGIKLFADGAIGSATAAIYGDYSGEAPDGPRISPRSTNASETSNKKVSGQLIYKPEKFSQMVQIASEAGYQIATHSIGDYATDLVLDAYALTSCPEKHRIEHAMMLSDEQIDRIANLGCRVSMQPEFLSHFSHTYSLQLGHNRASKLKRYRSLLDAGIPLSLSTDRPIVDGNPIDSIATAVTRPIGFDPNENISLEEAFRGWTSAAADANQESHLYGSIDVQYPALFNVFSDNPSIKLGNYELLNLKS